jgi:hypothetical protein
MPLKDIFAFSNLYFFERQRDFDHCKNEIIDSDNVVESMLFLLELFLQN